MAVQARWQQAGAQRRRRPWPGSKAAAAGGSDALLGPALGKQGSRAEEGERRERESRERKRFDLKFSQKFSHELENLQKQKLFKI